MKKVKWNPTSLLASEVLSPPLPARKYQPDWYKKMSAFVEGRPNYRTDGTVDKTLKHCIPFRDSVDAGYIMESWQEINFEFSDDGSFSYVYPTEPAIVSNRDHVSMDMGDEYHPIEFVLHPQWQPELPSGWSMLYTQPLNRPELPFFFPSGIVDADKFVSTDSKSSLPFYVKKSFTGTLPIGTPLVQMIPLKRESWLGSGETFDAKKQTATSFEVHKQFWGGYKKFAWSKKSYK